MINLPAELGWISKNLPLGPRGRFLLTHPRSAGRFIPDLALPAPALPDLALAVSTKELLTPIPGLYLATPDFQKGPMGWPITVLTFFVYIETL